MEHYKSTLSVTGIAVLGLVSAAGILHPANFERSSRLAAKPAIAASAPATSWVDPPASGQATRRRAVLSDVAALMKPEPTTVLPADGAMVQPLPAELTLIATTARQAETGHVRKVTRRATATRQAALSRPIADPVPNQQVGQASTGAEKVDPIGDLIRGLGLGSDS